MKKNIIQLFTIILFLTPLIVKAEESSMQIALGKFFNHKINSLIFKQTPNIIIFQSDVSDSGATYIPNPLGGLRPIGVLDLVNIPGRVLINLSNYVFEEVGR